MAKGDGRGEGAAFTGLGARSDFSLMDGASHLVVPDGSLVHRAAAEHRPEGQEGGADVAADEAAATAPAAPALQPVDKADLEAVRGFLPGKLLGRTAALLALIVLVGHLARNMP